MRELTNTGIEFIVLALRIALVFFLYLFLFQVLRTIQRELSRLGSAPAAVAAGAAGGAGSGVSSSLGRLTIVNPGQTGLPPGHSFPLSSVNTIGRRGDTDIPLNDSFISTEHTLVEWRGDGWWVEDLGSTNGTWINEIEVISATPASYGDIIRVGRVELKLTQ